MRSTLSVIYLATAMALPASSGWPAVQDGHEASESHTENQQLASLPSRDISKRVVLSHWSLRLPMVADAEDPAVVAWVAGGNDLARGDRVVSVNGIGVVGVNAVPAALRLSSEPGDRTSLDVDLGISTDGGNTVKRLSLPIVQDTVLGNGLRFETIHNGNVWETTLVKVPEGVETDLEVGDRILANGAGQPFNTRTSLSEVFEAMRREGTDEFEVFIMRGDAFMTRVLAY